jgi:uncharacterized protein YabE (DUF348 family)
MIPYLKTKIVLSALLISCTVFFIFALVATFSTHAAPVNFNSESKQISISDGGLSFQVTSSDDTVGQLLADQKIKIGANDLVTPGVDEKIYSGSSIKIERAKKITIKNGNNSFETYTLQNTVEQAVWENKNIDLDEDDITSPARTLPVKDGMVISVTHVLIKEETDDVDIPFKTVSNSDDSLGWRIKKITQPGQTGTNEIQYKVVYYNGKEISRKILSTNKIKDPVDQIVTQGTLVKVGKTYSGAGSWYSYTGTLAAANPWLPMGSYARVTNTDNGKSVIVVINDRGPFGNGRIIDLDKVAFEKIADIGAGVANVKVEAITN